MIPWISLLKSSKRGATTTLQYIAPSCRLVLTLESSSSSSSVLYRTSCSTARIVRRKDTPISMIQSWKNYNYYLPICLPHRQSCDEDRLVQPFHRKSSRLYHPSSTDCCRQQKPTLSKDDDHKKESFSKPIVTQDTTTEKEEKNDEKKDTTATTNPSSKVLLHHWLEQLQSIPNQITMARIASTPLLSYWIITDATWPAILGCSLAAASDALDGYLARRYSHMSTTLGTYLDPFGTYMHVYGRSCVFIYIFHRKKRNFSMYSNSDLVPNYFFLIHNHYHDNFGSRQIAYQCIVRVAMDPRNLTHAARDCMVHQRCGAPGRMLFIRQTKYTIGCLRYRSRYHTPPSTTHHHFENEHSAPIRDYCHCHLSSRIPHI
jgi:hypothetical protein